MQQSLVSWWRAVQERERGQDLAEYALLIALISVALVALLVAMRGGMMGVLQRATDILVNATQ